MRKATSTESVDLSGNDSLFGYFGFGEHEPNVLGEIRLDDPEIAWRLECLTAWHAAIVQQIPASRDLMDYLGPNLTPQAFTDPRSS